MFVDGFVENAFATLFVLLAITLVLWNVGLQAMIETGFASFLSIESAVGIEVGSSDRQTLFSNPAEGGSQMWLPFFLAWSFIRGLWLVWTKPIQAVHIGDPVLTLLGLSIRSLGRVPVFTTAHGLDVTFASPVYQRMIRFGLRRLDGVVCISEYTRHCQAWLSKNYEKEFVPVKELVPALRITQGDPLPMPVGKEP